jgi:hypothetical protein
MQLTRLLPVHSDSQRLAYPRMRACEDLGLYCHAEKQQMSYHRTLQRNEHVQFLASLACPDGPKSPTVTQ